jgi:hypothetical protein
MRIAPCGICGARADLSAPTRAGGRLGLCFGCARALGEAWARRNGRR